MSQPENRSLPIKVEQMTAIDFSPIYLITLTKKGARLYSGMTLRFDPASEKLEIVY